MAQVSKYPISKYVYEKIFKIFTKTLVKLKSEKEAEKLIEDLLTPTERVMLAKRLAIAFLLEKDYEYREITKILRVSMPTIASVNLIRKYGGQGYKKAISKLLREEEIKKFLIEVAELLTSVPAKGTKGSEGWRYLHKELEKKKKEKTQPFG